MDNLVYLVQTAERLIGDFQWSVAPPGASSSHDHPRPAHGRPRPGGLEDNLYLDKGVLAKNSGEQVAKLIRNGRELGIEPATPAEAGRSGPQGSGQGQY